MRNKHKMTTHAGMKSFEHKLPAETTQKELLTLIEGLNSDPDVHGILVQLPLPDHIDEQAVLAAIDPAKDVDGFHVVNAGKLATGADGLVPCTPLMSFAHQRTAGRRSVGEAGDRDRPL